MKVMLDVNIYDALEDAEFRTLYDRAVAQQKIIPVDTHITHDQLREIPDDAKRSSVLSIANLHQTTTTYGIVSGVSRLDWSSFAPEGTLDSFLGDQKSTLGNLQDALIASTAMRENALLVTNDSRLKNRCRSLGLSVMSSIEFTEYLRSKVD